MIDGLKPKDQRKFLPQASALPKPQNKRTSSPEAVVK
jgi:hypothetical protein